MFSFSSLALLALLYTPCLVSAIPLVARGSLDVASPPITYPTQGVVWTAGQTQTVTWDISNLPVNITNPTGTIVLGWIDSKGGYNLQLGSPIASGFPITAAKVDITVPSGYPDGTSYIIALIGSSGNISPTFTITNGGGSPASTNTPANTQTPTSQTPTPQVASVPGGQPTPSTAPGTNSPLENNASPPSPSSSTHPSLSPSSSVSSNSNPTSSPSGNSQSSSSSNDAAWGNKPASMMIVSLLAGSLVMLFL